MAEAFASGAAVGTVAVTVPDDAYASGWDGSLQVPTKNAIFDKLQTMSNGFQMQATYTSDVGNSGTTETDIYSKTLSAGLFAADGDQVEAYYSGSFVSSGTATRQLKVYFGGTAIFDSGALTLSLSSAWRVEVNLIRVSSSIVRYSVGMFTQGASSAAYTASGAVTGLTLTNTQVLKITGTAAGVGAASNDIVGKSGSVVFQPLTSAGTGSPSLVLIQRQVLGSAASTITFSNVSGAYNDLVLVLNARGTVAATTAEPRIQFNADTGNNYDWILENRFGTANGNGVGFARIGEIVGSTSPSSTSEALVVDIPDYAQTSFHKTIATQGWTKTAASGAGTYQNRCGGWWRNTAAITQIDLTLSSGNFDTGTTAKLYGRL